MLQVAGQQQQLEISQAQATEQRTLAGELQAQIEELKRQLDAGQAQLEVLRSQLEASQALVQAKAEECSSGSPSVTAHGEVWARCRLKGFMAGMACKCLHAALRLPFAAMPHTCSGALRWSADGARRQQEDAAGVSSGSGKRSRSGPGKKLTGKTGALQRQNLATKAALAAAQASLAQAWQQVCDKDKELLDKVCHLPATHASVCSCTSHCTSGQCPYTAGSHLDSILTSVHNSVCLADQPMVHR